MNKAILVGNLTRDPEKRTTPSGLSVTTFSIAVQRRISQGEQKADFLNIVTWRGLADNCAKYLQKGSKVGVVGQIQTRQYDDKNGVRRTITEIIADEVEFLSARGAQGAEGDAPASGTTDSKDDLFAEELAAFEPVDDDSLPF